MAMNLSLQKTSTYHIYLRGECLFKDLDDYEFNIIWGRLYHSYWDDITFSRVKESKDQLNLEPSY